MNVAVGFFLDQPTCFTTRLPPPPLADSGAVLDRTGILSMRSFTPTADYATSSATLAEVDAANLWVRFTAPRSGKVKVSIEAIWQGSASAWQYVALASGGAAVAGTSRGVGVDSGRQRRPVTWLLTGLTPGTEYTYTLMMATGTEATEVRIAGNNTDGRGDILFTAEAVPA